MRRSLLSALAMSATLVMTGSAVAAPINIDLDRGDPGAGGASFVWQGLEFQQQNQPGSRVSADGRVEGDSEGELNIFLEEGQSSAVGSSAKITFGAQLPVNDEFKLGFKQLSQETNAFSNLQGFFRTPSAGPNNTVVQLLVGVDENNPGSPFAGVSTRADSESSFQVSDFVDNTPLGAEGLFRLNTQADGFTSSDVRIDGRSANVSRDLGNFTDFRFNELLLQVETFQSDSDFQNQFPDGQQFTFTQFEVPITGTAWLMGAGLLMLGGLGRRRMAV